VPPGISVLQVRTAALEPSTARHAFRALRGTGAAVGPPVPRRMLVQRAASEALLAPPAARTAWHAIQAIGAPAPPPVPRRICVLRATGAAAPPPVPRRMHVLRAAIEPALAPPPSRTAWSAQKATGAAQALPTLHKMPAPLARTMTSREAALLLHAFVAPVTLMETPRDSLPLPARAAARMARTATLCLAK
jgi:hypothetical protein